MAAYGYEDGREAAAEALAYGWEHWAEVRQMPSPVTASEIKAKNLHIRTAVVRLPKPRPTLLGAAVTGVTAAGIAVALVASQGGTAAPGAVLTAAALKQIADASAAAMTSGQADIDWSGSGSPSDVRQQISFDGANWNDVLGVVLKAQITVTGTGA